MQRAANVIYHNFVSTKQIRNDERKHLFASFSLVYSEASIVDVMLAENSKHPPFVRFPPLTN